MEKPVRLAGGPVQRLPSSRTKTAMPARVARIICHRHRPSRIPLRRGPFPALRKWLSLPHEHAQNRRRHLLSCQRCRVRRVLEPLPLLSLQIHACHPRLAALVLRARARMGPRVTAPSGRPKAYRRRLVANHQSVVSSCCCTGKRATRRPRQIPPLVRTRTLHLPRLPASRRRRYSKFTAESHEPSNRISPRLCFPSFLLLLSHLKHALVTSSFFPFSGSISFRSV